MKTIFRMLSVLLLTTGLLSSCIQIGEGIQPSKKLITRDYKVKATSIIHNPQTEKRICKSTDRITS